MILSSIWLKAFSQLFLNLSAGWFGAVFIVPVLSGKLDMVSLTINSFYGILSLVLHVRIEEVLFKNGS